MKAIKMASSVLVYGVVFGVPNCSIMKCRIRSTDGAKACWVDHTKYIRVVSAGSHSGTSMGWLLKDKLAKLRGANAMPNPC